jgi:hypothetical protein
VNDGPRRIHPLIACGLWLLLLGGLAAAIVLALVLTNA